MLPIKKLKGENPACIFYFGTRGAAVVYDVVLSDALDVGMDEYARIVSNGGGSPGTLLKRISEAFRAVYDKADVVISKGQANDESLSEDKEGHFLPAHGQVRRYCPRHWGRSNADGMHGAAIIRRRLSL